MRLGDLAQRRAPLADPRTSGRRRRAAARIQAGARRRKKEKKKKAFKELLALNEPRSSIYCSIVHVIWQQKMHHLRARGENQRN